MKDFLTNATNAVRKFHEVFDQPRPSTPTLMPFERVVVRAKWSKEEAEELEDPAKQEIEDQCDASLDLIYFALSNFVEIGIDPTPLFQIVQDANMAKVWPDGTVHKNEQGKILKPPGWVAPEPLLRAEIARQVKAAIKAPDHEFFNRGAKTPVPVLVDTTPEIEVDFELAPVEALAAE